MNRNIALTIGGSVLSSAVAGLSGYFYSKRKLTAAYASLADREIQEARLFYTRLGKQGDYETPEKAVQALIPDAEIRSQTEEMGRIVLKYQGQDVEVVGQNTGLTDIAKETVVTEVTEEPQKIEVETSTNIFLNGNPVDPDDFDIEEEKSLRRAEEPYVISEEEWTENESNNDQVTLTYFREDDTLVDENENTIEKVNETVGKNNLNRFGQGSNDPRTVFVRNEKLGTDFEIIESRGSYIEEVLGITSDAHLEHSRDRRHRNQRRTVFDE